MRKPYDMICIILLLFLTACGSNHHSSSDTGSISFNLQLSHPTTMSRAAAATSADICTDYGITHINAKIVNSSGADVVFDDWECSEHSGTIDDVPAGADYTIRITGTVTGINAWSGEKRGISVTAGESTTAGTITIAYDGSDDVLPYIDITSLTPSSEATGVPVTSLITARFSEKMAASTINDSTFILSLKNSTTPVSGSVVYVAGTRSAFFSPSSILLYSKNYTATLTTDIADMATNKISSVYEWSFTTEDLPLSNTPPVAPAGLIAFSGDQKNIITWNAVSSATSYDIYWSKTSGVKKDDGVSIKIPDISTNSYTHAGLTNGVKYYYVVTSRNSDRESVESYEISSAPGSIEANPPTGSVTINNNDDNTNSRDVTLSLSSSSTRGISQMCISDTIVTALTQLPECSSWEPYTSSKPWTLTTTGDGQKQVVAWFKDSFNISTLNFFYDIIVLDTSPSD